MQTIATLFSPKSATKAIIRNDEDKLFELVPPFSLILLLEGECSSLSLAVNSGACRIYIE